MLGVGRTGSRFQVSGAQPGVRIQEAEGRLAGSTMRRCYCAPQPTPENVPSGTKSPQIGPPRDGQRVMHFPGLCPQKLAGAKRFGLRSRLAGPLLRVELARGAAGVAWGKARKNSSKLTGRRENVYENKGPLWKTCGRSWNVIENKDSYTLEAGMLGAPQRRGSPVGGSPTQIVVGKSGS